MSSVKNWFTSVNIKLEGDNLLDFLPSIGSTSFSTKGAGNKQAMISKQIPELSLINLKTGNLL